MANQGRKREPLETLGEKRLVIGGSFAPNGSSALVAADMYGTTGWSVAYTSTGLYTVTLEDVWQYLLYWSLGLMRSSDADGDLKLGAVDLSARTLQIKHLVAGTLTDIPANAGNRISFDFTIKRSANSGKR